MKTTLGEEAGERANPRCVRERVYRCVAAAVVAPHI